MHFPTVFQKKELFSIKKLKTSLFEVYFDVRLMKEPSDEHTFTLFAYLQCKNEIKQIVYESMYICVACAR